MPLISDRLREQREALGMTQAELAEKCGIAARSQRNYESGERSPDADYMAAIARAGADVLYILTGQRNPTVILRVVPPKAVVLSPREAALIDNYKHTGEEGKKDIESRAALAAQSKTLKKA